MIDPERCSSNTVTITAGGTVSTVFDKSHHQNIALLLPANWVTSAITLKGCNTPDGTFLPILKASDAGAVTVAAVAADNIVVFDGAIKDAIAAVPFIQLVSTEAQITTDKIIIIVKSRI
jgi:hypothetical protein